MPEASKWTEPEASKWTEPKASKRTEPEASGPSRRPDPEPLETDDRWVVIAGTLVWIVAFLVLLLFFRHDLRRHHTEWWLWSCWVGVALGVYGFRFVNRRQRAIARDRAKAPQE